MLGIRFHAFPGEALPRARAKFRTPVTCRRISYYRVLYAASDINPARNDVCYRDFLALVLSPLFAGLDEGVEGDGVGETGGGGGGGG